MNIQAGLAYSHAGYNVTSYFRSAVTVKNTENAVSDGFESKFLENGLIEDHDILRHYQEQSAPQTCWLLPVGCKM